MGCENYMLMLGFLGRFSFGLDRPGLMLGLSLSGNLGPIFMIPMIVYLG